MTLKIQYTQVFIKIQLQIKRNFGKKKEKNLVGLKSLQ